MAKIKESNEKLAYIFLEGFTEEIFYKRIFSDYLREIPKKIKNLETGSGINKIIARELDYFIKDKKNKNKDIYVYAFIDREGLKTDIPEFNGKAIKKELRKKQIKKVDKIEAIIMIESWFFHDLEGICDYIGLEYTDNLKSRYSNPERLTHRDLQGLFRKGTKKQHYRKGDGKFLSSLNIEKIVKQCDDLKKGIEMIKKDFNL